MIKEIYIENFRNINGKYVFNKKINAIFGENNSGKTNLIDAIRLAFSGLTGEYFRVQKCDFLNSDDSRSIIIKVLLEDNSISSFNCLDAQGNSYCGFMLVVSKINNKERYSKKVLNYDGSPVDSDIYLSDDNIPVISSHPIIRTEEIYKGTLTAGLSTFLDSADEYKKIKDESKEKIREQMKDKIEKFKELCSKFDKNIDVAFTEAKVTDEKIFIVDGENEHNYIIGSGFKSIANIMINGINNKFVIFLIDEIENHLHPSMLRLFLKTIKNLKNCMIICTTHSPIVINELEIDELISSTGIKFDNLDPNNIKKLQVFLHSGRCELLFAEEIVLVEGYSEELLLKNYCKKNNKNWTVVNVAGVMFYPYIELCKTLNKKLIVLTDTDYVLNDGINPSSRYNKLLEYCNSKSVKIISTYNTLESDLYNDKIIGPEYDYLLNNHNEYSNIKVAANNKKIEIVEKIITDSLDLSKWHIIKEIENEFQSN